jgi:HEAT repeat protein
MSAASEKIAQLVRLLGHSDKKIIRQSVDALVALAGNTPELRHEVTTAMTRAPVDKRWPMAYVLAQIAPLDNLSFDALKEALDTPDPDIRWAIVVLLVRLAKERGGNVVECLVALAGSGTATQRRMAMYALRDIGAQDDASQQAIRDALGDADPMVRVAALSSLKAFPELARSAVAEILRMLADDPDARVRATAAMALAQSGVEAPEVREALERAAGGNDPVVCKAARMGLEMLGKKVP